MITSVPYRALTGWSVSSAAGSAPVDGDDVDGFGEALEQGVARREPVLGAMVGEPALNGDRGRDRQLRRVEA
jgi:hypothetical protein